MFIHELYRHFEPKKLSAKYRAKIDYAFGRYRGDTLPHTPPPPHTQTNLFSLTRSKRISLVSLSHPNTVIEVNTFAKHPSVTYVIERPTCGNVISNVGLKSFHEGKPSVPRAVYAKWLALGRIIRIYTFTTLKIWLFIFLHDNAQCKRWRWTEML